MLNTYICVINSGLCYCKLLPLESNIVFVSVLTVDPWSDESVALSHQTEEVLGSQPRCVLYPARVVAFGLDVS